jgi:hypothetical protein
MKCVYFCKTLQKTVPCLLIPNKLYTYPDGRKYINVKYDRDELSNYGVTLNELYRYSSDTVRLIDIYPTNTPEQIAYATACIPNKVPNESEHKLKEFERMDQLIDMILSVPINGDTYHKLCDYISCEMLFIFLTQTERVFMLTLANSPFNSTTILVLISMYGGISCKTYINSVYKIFNAYEDNVSLYFLQNMMNLSDVIATNGTAFPIPLNISFLRQNVILLHDDGHLSEA